MKAKSCKMAALVLTIFKQILKNIYPSLWGCVCDCGCGCVIYFINYMPRKCGKINCMVEIYVYPNIKYSWLN